jgi:4-diphosphocytidyl-2-C-methyl-D-erythritol kinase
MKHGAFYYDTPFAKINLCLHLVGKRHDGYNNLFTVFYRIALNDELLLLPQSSGFNLICDQPEISGAQNLIARAYTLLQKKVGFKRGVSVFLSKGIPVAAGLGGASTDAASFLRGMNTLFQLGLTATDLRTLGRQLGADVPFFLTQWGSARGTGIGDILHKLNVPKDLWIILVTFKQGLSTKAVYEAFRYGSSGASLTKLSRDVTMLSRNFHRRDLGALSPFFKNDLQSVSVTMHSGLVRALDKMRRIGVPVCWMSGSGPTVAGLARSRQQAQQFAQQLEGSLDQGRVLVVRGI